MSDRKRALVLVALAAVLFSTGGAAIKATTLGAWSVAALRSGTAAFVLLAMRDARRSWTLSTGMVAISYCLTLTLFVHANKLTTAAETVFLQATSPLWVLLLAPFLLREHWRLRDGGLALLFAVGLVLAFVGASDGVASAPRPQLGNLLAAASGLTYALTIMGLRWFAGRLGSAPGAGLAAVAAGNLLACLVCLPFGWPRQIGATDLIVVLYLGVFQIAVAYLLLTRAMARLSAIDVALVLLLEPILSPLWAGLLHGERPSSLVLAGGSVIVAGTVISGLRERGPSAGFDGSVEKR